MIITLSKEAAKTLQGMDNVTRERIKQGLYAIPKGDIKIMQGFSDGRQRLRVGKYRAIFVYVTDNDGNNNVHVIELGSRGGIYK